MKKPSLKLHTAAVLFYGLLAFILLNPILWKTGSHTAGYDFFQYNWNFWWTRHALSSPDLSLFESNYIMFPAVTTYGYHTLTLFWFPLWAVTEPIIGTLAAVNLILWVGCLWNGYALFALLRSEKVAAGLALLGGAALQCFPIARYFYYNTHLNLFDWFWLPVHLLIWKQIVRAVDQRNYRRLVFWVLVQSLGLWGLALTDLQFPLFVGFLLVPYGLLTLWRSSQRIGLAAVGAVTVGLSLLLMWFAGPLSYMVAFEGTRVTSPVEERPGIPLFRGFFLMSDTWWDWATPSVGAFITLLLLISVLWGIWQFRQSTWLRWFWLALVVPPLVLSLGADLHLGETTIPLPYRLVYDITDGQFRMPWRLAPVFVVAGMVFAGLTWTEYFERLRSRRMLLSAGLFLLLAVDVRLFETAPLQPVLTEYTFYEAIGQEDGNYGVVEIPTGAGTGEVLLGDPRAIQFEYYGIIHEKPMVNGFIARAPLEHYWYLQTDDPMMAWLGQRRDLEPERVRRDMRQRISEWTIGYFVLHQDYVLANGGRPEEILGYFNAQPDLVCPVWIEGAAVVYRTSANPLGCPSRVPPEVESNVYQIDIGASGDERYLGWGWHWAETVSGVTLRWAGDQTRVPQTTLFFDLPPDANYELSLSAQAFWEARELRVLINDIPLEPVTGLRVETDFLQTLTFQLPMDVLGNGKDLRLQLVFDGWVIPAEVVGTDDERQLAVAVDWVKLKEVSAQ
jgi:hypothetical protein